jgi:hypothetical protein
MAPGSRSCEMYCNAHGSKRRHNHVMGYIFRTMRRTVSGLTVFALLNIAAQAADVPQQWLSEWPDTDFEQHSIDYGEVLSGGPPKDGIPSIDDPGFSPIADINDIPDTEPVVIFSHGGETKVYPLRILTWHEIVNDHIGGLPVAVTYCPLCNAAIVFDARIAGRALTFGTTGKLRKSDLIMYDRQTESWWQQFSGTGIAGEMNKQELKMLPARVDAFGRVKKRHPEASVLVADSSFRRPYGNNPYVGYDSSARPFLYDGELPPGIDPMMRVVVVDNMAWTLPLLRTKGRIEHDGVTLAWIAGQNSALDTSRISKGRDVGNVTVTRQSANGSEDAVHHVTFAFVFHAFHPDGKLFKE